MNYLSNISWGLRRNQSNGLETYPYFVFENLTPQLYYGMPYVENLGTDNTSNKNDALYAVGAEPTNDSSVFSPNTALNGIRTTNPTNYILCPYLPISTTTTLCVSFWVNVIEQPKPAQLIFDGGSSLNGTYFAIQESLRIFFRAWYNSETSGTLRSTTVSSGYHHIILVMQNGYNVYYIDNVLQYETTDANIQIVSPLNLYFSKPNPTSPWLPTFGSALCNIDKINVSFSDTLPSANDRLQLYELDSIRAYYTFDSFKLTTLYDKIIVNNASITGTCITNTKSHLGTYSALFSGNVASNSAPNYITFPELDMTKKIGCSFAFWIWNTNTTTGADSHVFDFTVDGNSSSYLFLSNSAVDNTSYTFGTQTFTMPVNEWVFCAITIGSGGALNVYVNMDAPINGGTATLPLISLDSGGLLSRTLDTSLNLQQFNGYIDQFQIYNWTLSSDGVALLYTKT